MAGFTYSIRFDALKTGNVSRTLEVLERIDKRIENLNTDVNRFGNNLANAGRKGQQAFSGMSSSVGGFITKVGVAAALLNSIQTGAQAEGVQKSIEFGTGSVEKGAKALQFLDRTTEDLGLNFLAATKGYKSLAASFKGGSLEKSTNDIFLALSEGSTVMRLSQDDFNGAITAIGQMASKGKVSAEELRGQLGERLPGAFQMAARAMGMTTMELDKQMSEGKIYADKFLPRFAAEMHRTYGAAVPEAAQSATANINRFQNAVYQLNATFGKELLPTVVIFLQKYLIPGVKWIGRNLKLMGQLAITVGSVWLVYKTWTFWIAASTAATKIGAFTQLLFAGNLGRAVAMAKLSSLATKGMTVAQTALNAVMAANPIGIVVTALFALGNAFMYAFNNSRDFRGWLEGTFRMLDEFGRVVAQKAGAIVKMMSLNPTMIAQGVAEFSSAGQQLGDAYNKGWNRGVGKFDAKNGVDPVNGAFANVGGAGGAGGGGSNDKITAGIDSITGGGKQTKNITINLNKLVESLNINSQTVDKGISQIRDLVQKELLQVLNSANQAQ